MKKPQHWSISTARKHFADLVRSAVHEPQPIYNRSHLVAAVVDAETFGAFLRWRSQQTARTLADAFADLRAICADATYELPEVPRQDRPLPDDEA